MQLNGEFNQPELSIDTIFPAGKISGKSKPRFSNKYSERDGEINRSLKYREEMPVDKPNFIVSEQVVLATQSND